MRFNVIDVVGRQSRIRKGRAYQSFLRKAIWRGKTAAATIVVDRRAANDGQYGVSIAERIRQALECKYATALAAHVAIGRSIKRFAPPVGRHHSGARSKNRSIRTERKIYASGQCHVGFAFAQTLQPSAMLPTTKSRRYQ